MKVTKVLITVTTLSLCLAAGACAGNRVEIRMQNDVTVVVPTSGPLYDKGAVSLAKDIKSLDRKAMHWEKKLTQSRADPEVVATTLEMIHELRDLSASQLNIAIFKAENTSAGFLDQSLIKRGKEYLDRSVEILGYQPTGLTVQTLIMSDQDDAVLHYVLVGDYERGDLSWSSYDFGQIMRIGNYVFQVSASSGGSGELHAQEVVIVLADPTEKTIRQR